MHNGFDAFLFSSTNDTMLGLVHIGYLLSDYTKFSLSSTSVSLVPRVCWYVISVLKNGTAIIYFPVV
jgi:hypothetical protein